jgi:hypothetical protein
MPARPGTEDTATVDCAAGAVVEPADGIAGLCPASKGSDPAGTPSATTPPSGGGGGATRPRPPTLRAALPHDAVASAASNGPP